MATFFVQFASYLTAARVAMVAAGLVFFWLTGRK
jgi:hypothetical protein